jgi:hypothetical protein
MARQFSIHEDFKASKGWLFKFYERYNMEEKIQQKITENIIKKEEF